MSTPKQRLERVLALPPANKIDLVNRLLARLDSMRKEIDQLHTVEGESRAGEYARSAITALKSRDPSAIQTTLTYRYTFARERNGRDRKLP